MHEEVENEERLKEMHAQKAGLERLRRLTSLVAGITSSVAIAGTVALAVGFFFGETKTFSREELSLKVADVERSNQKQNDEISQIRNELDEIGASIQAFSELPESAKWNAEASKIRHKLNIVSNRLSSLESALTVDPSKALAVPILRKDLDNAEKGLRSELEQTRAEIDRIYDQNKWFIGLMFTIALSVLGMAVSSVFGRKDT